MSERKNSVARMKTAPRVGEVHVHHHYHGVAPSPEKPPAKPPAKVAPGRRTPRVRKETRGG